MPTKSGAPFVLPRYMYHVTMIDAVPHIAKEGIRSGSEINKASHVDFPCVAGSVYLTTHAPFYCFQTVHGWLYANDPKETLYESQSEYPRTVILEIDTQRCPGAFHADEDALEQYERNATKYKMPAGGTSSAAFKKRHSKFMQRAAKCDNNDLAISFKWAGTVGHRGAIPWDAVTQVCSVDSESICEVDAFSFSGFYLTGSPTFIRYSTLFQSAITAKWFGREYDESVVPDLKVKYTLMPKEQILIDCIPQIKAIESKRVLTFLGAR